MEACSPDRHLCLQRAEAAGGCRSAHVLPRGPGRAGAAGRHHRGRRAFAPWLALATSYSTNNPPMLPFFIYYSMFGFQRFGDRPQAGDMRARGFRWVPPPGAPRSTARACSTRTAIRTFLQRHPQPPLPSIRVRLRGRRAAAARHAQDADRTGGRVLPPHPAPQRELPHPDMPEGAAEGIVKACIFARIGNREWGIGQGQSRSKASSAPCAADGLGRDPARGDGGGGAAGQGVRGQADIWSCTSFTELGRDGFDAERWNRLNPETGRRACLCDRAAAGPHRPGDRRDRLRAHLRRPDPRLRAGPLHRAGHRRLRPLRHPRQPAPFEVDRYHIATPPSTRWRRKAP